MADHLKVRAVSNADMGEGADFSCVFPVFIWAVRDFTLELVIDGNIDTPDGYLAHMLTYKKGNDID